MSPEADETIITRLVIDAVEALANLETFNEQLELTKEKLKELAELAGEPFGQIGERLKEALKTEVIEEFAERFSDIDQATEQTQEQIKELGRVIDEAVSSNVLGETADIVKWKDEIRAATDEIETTMQELAATGEDTFDTWGRAIKEAGLEKLNADLLKLKDNLKVLRSKQGIVGREKEFEFVDVSDIPEVIKRIAELTREIKVFRNAATLSFQEVNKEARQFIDVMKMLRGINLGAVRKEFEQTRNATVSFLNSMRGIHQATRPFNERLRESINNLRQFGKVGQLVFGGILGFTAVTALQRVLRAFTDFAKEVFRRGVEMSQIMLTFEISIRGLQRVGLDTTIAGWTERLQELKREFPFFPEREFTQAATLAALMTREFGFTEEQMANIVRQSVILSQITGKDLLESVRAITFAIGSGYFESLQRAGVNISRAVVKNEALAQGYAGVYNELEPTIRASVTYSVIQKNLNALQEDAGEFANTTAGRVRELTAAWIELRDTLGIIVTESEAVNAELEVLSGTVGSLTDAIKLLKLIIEGEDLSELAEDIPTEKLERLRKAVEELIKASTPGIGRIFGLDVTTEIEDRADAIQEFREALSDAISELSIFDQALGDLEGESIDIPISISVGGVDFTQEEYQEIRDAVAKLNEEILEIEADAAEKRIDTINDYLDDSEDIQENHDRRMEDLAAKHQLRLDDIETKRLQRREDEIADIGFKIAEAERNAAFRREEAQRKYRDRELKEERRFQEKLRQLRENFLLDLEDAVRERDARQIIRLTRQFNLRRDQMIRDEKLNKDDRRNAFEEELRRIEFQRQERLRQLAIEHERRLAAIDLQAERERAREDLEFQRKQEAEEARAFEEKQRRSDRLNEQLDDLDDATQDRINKVLEGIIKEYNLTEPQLKAIGDLWDHIYNKGGRIDIAIEYHLRRLAQLAAIHSAMAQRKMLDMTFIPPGFSGEGVGYAGRQAEGGTIIARKPTVAIFGEAGDEMATFTPLNKLDRTSTFGGQSPVGSKDSLMGRLLLELLLSPDLEARIIDNTLDEVAEVTYKVNRERR